MLMLDEIWYGNMCFEVHTSNDKEYKKSTKKQIKKTADKTMKTINGVLDSIQSMM